MMKRRLSVRRSPRPAFFTAIKLTKSPEYLINLRPLIFVVLAFIPTLGASGEDRLFLLRGNELHVFSAEDGAERGSRQIENADILLGTPGGKYIFVLDSTTGLGEAVDFEDPAKAKRIDLSDALPFTSLRFSPTGEILYVVRAGDSAIQTYSHRAGVLSPAALVRIPGAGTGRNAALDGTLALNSRGTRIYRSDAEGLGYYLTADGSRIRQVAEAAGGGGWVLAPGGRHLWGIDNKGWILVDEPRNRVAKRIDADEAGLPRFDPGGLIAWALADNGRTLVRFDVRRHRDTGRLNLNDRYYGPAPDGNGGLWLASLRGLFLLPESGSDEFADMRRLGDLPGEGEIRGFVSVRLKPNQGFACF